MLGGMYLEGALSPAPAALQRETMVDDSHARGGDALLHCWAPPA